MLRICRGAAITARHDFSLAHQALHHAFGHEANRISEQFHRVQFEMRAVGKMLVKTGEDIQRVSLKAGERNMTSAHQKHF